VASDSFEDLLALQRANPPARDELLELSTLLPTLAEWMAVLGLPRVYDDFRTILAESIPNTDLQLWYPDAMIDGFMNRVNAGRESGATLSSIELPEQVATLRERVGEVAAAHDPWGMLSCLRDRWTWGALRASRHFRTPLGVADLPKSNRLGDVFGPTVSLVGITDLPKPKRMHWATYWRIIERADEYELRALDLRVQRLASLVGLKRDEGLTAWSDQETVGGR
jgi:hypothetical protein